MFDHLKNIDYSKGVIRGHFAANITIKNIMDISYWWPTLFETFGNEFIYKNEIIIHFWNMKNLGDGCV
jgi:hypothetical protein